MPQGKGTYGDQVGRPSKEDKSKGMPYAPFKMSGHTLPGPNQSSALKERSQATPEGLAKDLGLNSSFLGREFAQFGNKMGKTQVGENYEGGEDYNAIKEAENTQPYVNSGDSDISAVDDGTIKKKVDVEVTVNDKKV